MPDTDEDIAICHACGNAMNVAAVGPFSNVECPTCGEKTRVKREFGPYTLVSRHAVGGMSMVFLAQDNLLGREVALKILSEDFSADEKRVTAFEEEARITASFSHPNVVRVLTTGKAFGRLYIAMELVPGGHFEHQIRERGKIPEIEMLPLAIEVAQGLKAAHSAGLIHRDVKPGNILLDAEGHAKLVDFGLALVTQGGKAQAAEIWATPYYVPPETIEGFAEDFRSDVYAFGATLYHALTGKPSCGEESMATNVLREAKRRVTPLALAEPTISVETCKIVQRAMAYDAKDRFSSYDELIGRLESALKRLKTAGAAESAASAAKRQARSRNEERVTMGIAGAVLLLGVAASVWWVTREDPKAKKPVSMVVDPAIQFSDDGGQSDAAMAVAKSYRQAREAVAAKDFDRALKVFSELHGNPEVQEPTRTWAGVEAVVVAYLNGDAGNAKLKAAALGKHIGQLPETVTKPDESLIRVLGLQSELPVIAQSALDRSRADSSHLISWMLAALKNWEQGSMDHTHADFRSVVSADVSADERWLSIYQTIAKDYLSDQELMANAVFSTIPEDAEGCTESIASLDTIHAKLKTLGRAKFNVRAWQLDLARRGKQLSASEGTSGGKSAGKTDPAFFGTKTPGRIIPGTAAPFGTRTPPGTAPAVIEEDDEVATPVPSGPVPELPEVMEKIAGFVAKGGFTEAADYVGTLSGDPVGATRESLARVATDSSAFLTDLENSLRGDAFSGDFKLRSGSAFQGISLDGQGNVTVTTASGPQTVTWAEIEPDSLVALHRIVVKNPMEDSERLLRHERAICYDWLAGNRTRATSAAALLSQGNPDFKARWTAISSGLPK